MRGAIPDSTNEFGEQPFQRVLTEVVGHYRAAVGSRCPVVATVTLMAPRGRAKDHCSLKLCLTIVEIFDIVVKGSSS